MLPILEALIKKKGHNNPTPFRNRIVLKESVHLQGRKKSGEQGPALTKSVIKNSHISEESNAAMKVSIGFTSTFNQSKAFELPN